MSNVYAAPTASLSHTHETAPTVMFAVNSRIGRLRWIAYSMGMFFLCNLVAGMFQGALGRSFSMIMVGYAVQLLLALAGSAFVSRRRLRDLGKGPAYLLLAIIPVVNLYFLVLMLFQPGDEGSNQYGPPPSPNTRGVYWGASILPLTFILGIAAAIAIPAYQSYQHKAQAARSSMQAAPQR